MKCFAILICCLLLAGCTTPQHAWPNQNRDVVWTAMVAAAKAPEYNAIDPKKRWIVLANTVEVRSETGIILIRRKLARSIKLPRQVEQTDERDWFFTIQLLPGQLPKATFDTVGQTLVPARVQDEAQRYFEQVDELVQNEAE
ncbi:MAG: hypothetical protein H8E86_01070 [Planctomycetes bacterium]|nr:hypothetical protein [Planctomycetota bacterium]